jgi:hypothetical protein
MRNLTLDKMITGKHGYERYLSLLGIKSKGYHANNGQFADKGFWDDCSDNDQSITFCGVSSHHQNGSAERIIKDLMLGARIILLHAKQMLPEYISTVLWPFALKCTEDWMNNLVHCADGRTPYKSLTGLDSVKLDVSNFHTFGCPCYVLDHCLQSGNSMVPKWEPRAQMGTLDVHPHMLQTLL